MVLLFPNFQRSFGLRFIRGYEFQRYLPSPFYRGCKSKSLYFFNQNYLKKLQTFSVAKNHFKNYRFFKRTAKIRGEKLLPNFIRFLSHVFTFHQLISASMNNRFTQTGGEDRIVLLITKFF